MKLLEQRKLEWDIQRALENGYKYISRDNDSQLFLWNKRPIWDYIKRAYMYQDHNGDSGDCLRVTGVWASEQYIERGELWSLLD